MITEQRPTNKPIIFYSHGIDHTLRKNTMPKNSTPAGKRICEKLELDDGAITFNKTSTTDNFSMPTQDTNKIQKRENVISNAVAFTDWLTDMITSGKPVSEITEGVIDAFLRQQQMGATDAMAYVSKNYPGELGIFFQAFAMEFIKTYDDGHQ